MYIFNFKIIWHVNKSIKTLCSPWGLLKTACGARGIVCATVEEYATYLRYFYLFSTKVYVLCTGPCSAVGNVPGNRYEYDSRSRGREFDPGPVPYFRGD